MVADGHADDVRTVLGRGYNLSVLAADASVDIEVTALYGIVGALVEHISRNGERRYVLEVYAAVYERRCADVARRVLGRELVNAQRGHYHVVCTVAAEGNAADDEVSLGIGVAEERELRALGHHGARHHGLHAAEAGVVAVRHAAGLGVVIGIGLSADALVHRPVGKKVVFGAGEHVVVVLQDFGVRKGLSAEHAHFVHVAAEGVVGVERIASAHAEAALGARVEGDGRECDFLRNHDAVELVDCRQLCRAALADAQRERGVFACRQGDARRFGVCTLYQQQFVARICPFTEAQAQLAAEVEEYRCAAVLLVIGAYEHLYGEVLVLELLVEHLSVEVEEESVAGFLSADGIELCRITGVLAVLHQADACVHHSRSRAVGDASRNDTRGAAEALVTLKKLCFCFAAGGG